VATVCLLGLPADRLVYGDGLERKFWQLVADRAVDLNVVQRDNQARATANEVGSMLRRLFRRRGPGNA
jgi:hypothetical protein